MRIEEGQWLVTGRFLPVTCGLCTGPVQQHISVDPDDKTELWACACGKTASLHLPEGKLDLGLPA